MQYFTIAKHNLLAIYWINMGEGEGGGVLVVLIDTQHIIAVCPNNISNRVLVASCVKIDTN